MNAKLKREFERHLGQDLDTSMVANAADILRYTHAFEKPENPGFRLGHTLPLELSRVLRVNAESRLAIVVTHNIARCDNGLKQSGSEIVCIPIVPEEFLNGRLI
jgi:hypothetical protein